MQRAEVAGFKEIVVTLATWITGWRPRDLAASNFPQLRGHWLANSTSDQVFGARLANAPEADMRAAVLEGLDLRKPVDFGTTCPGSGRSPTCRSFSRASCIPTTYVAPRARRRRHLPLQPWRSPTQRRSCRVGHAASRGDRSRWSAGVVRLGSVRSGADLIRALGARRNRRVVARTSTAWLSKARTASSTYCAHCLPKPT